MELDTGILDRFHQVLVAEIRRSRPDYLAGPFPVSAIYKELVPYRTHRDKIGAGMSAEYEHTLLRLLSGERGYLRLEPEPARVAILRELASRNPNTAIYQQFAEARVSLDLRTDATPASRDALADQADRSVTARDDRAQGQREQRHPEGESFVAPWEEAAPPAPAPGAAPEIPAPASCWSCGAELPPRTNLRFCAFCGVNVLVRPCPACGEELDRSWRYCIACGHALASP